VNGSTLELTNSCFLSNNFVGRAAVLVDDIGSLKESGNYGTYDANLECQFVDALDASCIGYSSPTCLAEKYPLVAASLATGSPSVQSTEMDESAKGGKDQPSSNGLVISLFSTWATIALAYLSIVVAP
jgi:hypothetical protein